MKNFGLKLIFSIPLLFAFILSVILFFAADAESAEPKKENHYSKYLGVISICNAGFVEGANQGWFFMGEQSKWPAYNKGSAHAWWFFQR